MPDIKNLTDRIDAAMAAADSRLKQSQQEQVAEHQARQARLAQLEQAFDELREVWRPRLEALATKFGDRVKLKPSITPGRREATFAFQSELARINLRLSASTDAEVRKVVIGYDLEIVPILMQFDTHAELELPLGKLDREAVAAWLDDRIVSFVETYLSLYQNEYYLQGHMVEDPVAKVRFPKFAAACTLERDGKTYYFVNEQTRSEFAREPSK